MFTDIHEKISFSDAINKAQSKTKSDTIDSLEKVSRKMKLNFEDYLSLVSPSADDFLEDMAYYSKKITEDRFGKTIQFFMPLYLSNECRSSCMYCGFSYENKIPRVTLSLEEIEREAKLIYNKGIRHVLILTGEDYSKTPVSFLFESILILKKYFSSISLEVYPLKIEEYSKLISVGADGLTLYQETYDKEVYAKVHKRGVKKDMGYRLSGPDRGGIAGFRRIGIGALLGLSDPLGEMFFLGLHAEYLIKTYWRSLVQVSFPRMRPTKSEFQINRIVSDREFLRFIFAIRLFQNDSPIALSTRERAELRDKLFGLGITTISAGSKTEPGGYSGSDALEQFSIEDKREMEEVVEKIRLLGIDPVLKDFDRAILG
ncbi:MAG: 2-iminoacetate synthase ThiH [Leptospiraceae bacterium]|nr:2-iminoacetate synthase ThiH [Leptospiraceae bacterium]MCK6382236.1 2-iminoacetate synthase ThiH [Leptospiraceae bacterium]NUM40592.1 2-iminoacetate synthase ThiH [Leptospiraceae bacterium]